MIEICLAYYHRSRPTLLNCHDKPTDFPSITKAKNTKKWWMGFFTGRIPTKMGL